MREILEQKIRKIKEGFTIRREHRQMVKRDNARFLSRLEQAKEEIVIEVKASIGKGREYVMVFPEDLCYTWQKCHVLRKWARQNITVFAAVHVYHGGDRYRKAWKGGFSGFRGYELSW